MNSLENAYIFTQSRPGQPGYFPDSQFPGMQFGGTVQQIKNLIGRQKGSRGFALPVAIGTNEFQLQLPGDAAILLGFCLLSFNVGESFSIKINGEIILDQVPASCFSSINRTIPDEYYILPRPLSGQDEIILSFTATGARTQQFVFHYLKAPIQVQ